MLEVRPRKGPSRLSKLLLQDLIISLFELYSPRDYISAAALVTLLEELEVAPGAARSSISRLKGKEILHHDSTEAGPQYTLSPAVRAQQKWNVQRVFTPERSVAGDPWALVIYSVPEPNRQHRYTLKRELTDLGFGFVAPGVAIAPHRSLPEALFRLEQYGLLNYITYFTADYGDASELPMKVRQWWDLTAVEQQYQEFIDQYAPVLDKLSESAAYKKENEHDFSESTALAFYVPLYTRWKPFPYHDPNIPLRILPAGWPAPRAKFVFLQLDRLLSAPAYNAARRIIDER